MPASANGNIGWISNLRLIALYAVIMLHCTSPLLMQYGKVPAADWWLADFFNAAVRFAVPVFVMVTGALTLGKTYTITAFLKKRLSRVVVPFLFWSLVYIAYAWYNDELVFGKQWWPNIKLILHQLKYGSSYHLWYVYMLIGLYLFIPVLSKFVRNATEKEILYFLLVWFLVMLLSQPYLNRFNPAVDLHYFTGYAGYLVLGYYLANKEFDIKYLWGWMILLFVSSIGIITVGSYLLIANPTWPGTMLYEPLNPVIVVLSVSIFLVVKHTTPRVSPVILQVRDFAGKYNYGIYLAHALVLYLLDDFLGISHKLCTPVVSIPLTALICIMLSLLLVWLINKIPFIGKWISG